MRRFPRYGIISSRQFFHMANSTTTQLKEVQVAIEPGSAFLGKKAIDVALGLVIELLKAANERNRSEVERCSKFLEACSAAISGLEQEYDEILAQTVNCPNEPAAVGQLKQRIWDYLHIDKLRTKLIDATTGLASYEERFRNDAERFLDWPWRWANRAEREEAVKRFSKNLDELYGYLLELNQRDLPHRATGTGIYQEALHEILKTIDTPAVSRNVSLRDLGQRFLAERKREPGVRHVKRIREATEEMRKAFL
jgi:hypothetical protein